MLDQKHNLPSVHVLRNKNEHIKFQSKRSYFFGIMLIRIPLILALLKIAASTGGTYEPYENQSDVSLDCGCPQNPVLEGGSRPFSSFVGSPAYISLASARLLPPDSYDIITSRLPGASSILGSETDLRGILGFDDLPREKLMPVRDTTEPVDLALSTTGTPVPLEEFGVEFNEEIPFVDFIATTGINDLREILNQLDYISTLSGPAGLNEAHARINVPLFVLASAVDQLSQGKQISVVLWKKILWQLSYRISIGLARHKWSSVADFDAEIRPVLEGLLAYPVSSNPAPANAVAPLVLLIAPVVINVGVKVTCWCIRYWKDRYSTTTTTTTEAPTTTFNRAYLMKSPFFISAHKDLDEIVSTMVSITGVDFARKLASARALISDRCSSIASALYKLVSSSSGEFNPETSIKLSFQVIGKLNEEHTQETWPAASKWISDTISTIRTELYKFALY